MGDRSVVICVVTPSIMLDGTAASMTQRKRRPPVSSSASLACVAVETTGSLLPCPPLGCGCFGPFLMAVDLSLEVGGEGAGAGGVAVTSVDRLLSGGSMGGPSGIDGRSRTGASRMAGAVSQTR